MLLPVILLKGLGRYVWLIVVTIGIITWFEHLQQLHSNPFIPARDGLLPLGYES
jgi:hypothetical protein